jgi:hypothetical protein
MLIHGQDDGIVDPGHDPDGGVGHGGMPCSWLAGAARRATFSVRSATLPCRMDAAARSASASPPRRRMTLNTS